MLTGRWLQVVDYPGAGKRVDAFKHLRRRRLRAGQGRHDAGCREQKAFLILHPSVARIVFRLHV